MWIDKNVAPLQSAEWLGFLTQKPESLLERIINGSSNEGDWILDPFCGCGTTVAVAEKLNRNWIGIDITTLAINLIKYRLLKQFEVKITSKDITLNGLPKDLIGAEALFQKDPFEFEYWALDLINAMPAKSKAKGQMRGADKGVDGVISFRDIDEKQNIFYKKIIVQVKGGKVQRGDIAKLKGDSEREKAEGGILITLEKPTKQMITEANVCGFFETNFPKSEFPKIQIITIQELLDGKKPNLPKSHEVNYYKTANRIRTEPKGKQERLES